MLRERLRCACAGMVCCSIDLDSFGQCVRGVTRAAGVRCDARVSPADFHDPTGAGAFLLACVSTSLLVRRQRGARCGTPPPTPPPSRIARYRAARCVPAVSASFMQSTDRAVIVPRRRRSRSLRGPTGPRELVVGPIGKSCLACVHDATCPPWPRRVSLLHATEARACRGESACLTAMRGVFSVTAGLRLLADPCRLSGSVLRPSPRAPTLLTLGEGHTPSKGGGAARRDPSCAPLYPPGGLALAPLGSVCRCHEGRAVRTSCLRAHPGRCKRTLAGAATLDLAGA